MSSIQQNIKISNETTKISRGILRFQMKTLRFQRKYNDKSIETMTIVYSFYVPPVFGKLQKTPCFSMFFFGILCICCCQVQYDVENMLKPMVICQILWQLSGNKNKWRLNIWLGTSLHRHFQPQSLFIVWMRVKEKIFSTLFLHISRFRM